MSQTVLLLNDAPVVEMTEREALVPAVASEVLRRLGATPLPYTVGGLVQTSVRRRATRASLSRPVHSSRGDLKWPAYRYCRRHGQFSLARLLHAPPPDSPHPSLRADGSPLSRPSLMPLCLCLLAQSGHVPAYRRCEERALLSPRPLGPALSAVLRSPSPSG